MKKFLFRFFLALSVILLAGHGNIFAYNHSATVSSFEESLRNYQEEAARTLKINHDLITSYRPFQTLNERATIDTADNKEENEAEEDQAAGEKEKVTAKSCYTLFFTAQAPQYIHYSIKKCLQD